MFIEVKNGNDNCEDIILNSADISMIILKKDSIRNTIRVVFNNGSVVNLNNETKEEARYVWDEVISEIESLYVQDEGFFWGIINSCSKDIEKVDVHYLEGIEISEEWTDYDKYFINHIWKAFVEQLKQELSEKQTK